MLRNRFTRVKKDGPPNDPNSEDELMIYASPDTGGFEGQSRVGQVDHLGNAHKFAWKDDLYPNPYTLKRVRGCWITYDGSLDGGGVVPAPANYPLDVYPVLHRKMYAGGIVRMQMYHFESDDLAIFARMIVTKVGVVTTQRACEVMAESTTIIHPWVITQLPFHHSTFQDGGTFWSSSDPTKVIIPEDGIYICTGWVRWGFIAE
jgi:hypothetical protein